MKARKGKESLMRGSYTKAQTSAFQHSDFVIFDKRIGLRVCSASGHTEGVTCDEVKGSPSGGTIEVRDSTE